MTARSAEHGTFTLTRTYPVPRERVFAAWASQEAKARWFGGGGAVNEALELDFRVGGTEVNRGDRPTARSSPMKRRTRTSWPTSESCTPTRWTPTAP